MFWEVLPKTVCKCSNTKRWGLVHCQARRRYVDQQRACIVLQSGVRGMLARGRCRNIRKQIAACITIQTLARRWAARRYLRTCLNAAVLIQRSARKCLARRIERRAYDLLLKNSVTSIQSAVRAWLARRKARRRRQAISVVQRRMAGIALRNKFLNTKSVAIRMQRAWRVIHRMRSEAAVTLQRAVRKWLEQSAKYAMLRSATKIQVRFHSTDRFMKSVTGCESRLLGTKCNSVVAHAATGRRSI